MNRKFRIKNIVIVWLILICIVSNVYGYKESQGKTEEINDLKKVTFELQMNSDKLQEINDTYYSRIVLQTEQINELEETVDRVMTLSSSEAEKVQQVVMSEARGSTLADVMAVTQTVLNRSQLWDKSATEVVEASGQYAKPFQGEINDKVRLAFELVYLDGYTAFKESVTHFYNKDLCSPAWAESKTVIGNVGSHVYMY